MLDALLILYPSFVQLPTSSTPPALRITENYRFAKYFKDCIRAIDGTHIQAACVPPEAQGQYRNRKGQLSQNILAACDFNEYFVYAGGEGYS